jgi:hypothetical protein
MQTISYKVHMMLRCNFPKTVHTPGNLGFVPNDKSTLFLHSTPKWVAVCVCLQMGNTVVHYAAIMGNLDCLKLLASRLDASMLQATNQHGKTPLHLAAAYGRTEVVQFLIGSKQVDVGAQDQVSSMPWARSVGTGKQF